MESLPFVQSIKAAWKQAGEDADFLLRFTGMRWEEADIDVRVGTFGMYPVKVDAAELDARLPAYTTRFYAGWHHTLAKLRVRRHLLKRGMAVYWEGMRRLAFFEHNLKTGLHANDATFKPYRYVVPTEVVKFGGGSVTTIGLI